MRLRSAFVRIDCLTASSNPSTPETKTWKAQRIQSCSSVSWLVAKLHLHRLSLGSSTWLLTLHRPPLKILIQYLLLASTKSSSSLWKKDSLEPRSGRLDSKSSVTAPSSTPILQFKNHTSFLKMQSLHRVPTKTAGKSSRLVLTVMLITITIKIQRTPTSTSRKVPKHSVTKHRWSNIMPNLFRTIHWQHISKMLFLNTILRLIGTSEQD